MTTPTLTRPTVARPALPVGAAVPEAPADRGPVDPWTRRTAGAAAFPVLVAGIVLSLATYLGVAVGLVLLGLGRI